MFNDYGSKIDLIVLKFGTDVAFIYLQVDRCPKKSIHYDQRYLRLNFFFYFRIACSQRILDLSTQNFNHLLYSLLHSLKTIFG